MAPSGKRHLLSALKRVKIRKLKPYTQTHFHHLAEIRRRTIIIGRRYAEEIAAIEVTSKRPRDPEVYRRVRNALSRQSEEFILLILKIAGIGKGREKIIQVWREIWGEIPRPISENQINRLLVALKERNLLNTRNEKRITLAFKDLEESKTIARMPLSNE